VPCRAKAALLLVLLLVYPAVLWGSDLPALGDASSGIVSPQQERQLGHAWLSLLRGQVKQLSDPLLKDFVESSVYRLAETSALQDRRLSFIFIDSPQLNAFAAPGGIVGVNGGIFIIAQTEAEYASVMAHELAHLSQRHFARGVQAQQRMQIPMLAALLAGVVAAAAGAGDLGMATIVSSQAAAFQEQMRFSRQNEQEADRFGLLNLERAGYDPRAMPAMFGRLLRQYRYASRPPEFLLTHPLTENRIADTLSRAEQYPPQGKQDSLAYQLVRTRMQLYYEETPGISFKRFAAVLNEQPNNQAARYGLTLALAKNQQIDEAGKALAPLLQQHPDNIIFNLAKIELDMAANRLDMAEKRLTPLLASFPDNYPLKQAQADLLLKQNKPALAEKVLDELLKSRGSDPDIWYQSAEARGLSGNISALHQARAEYFALTGDYEQALEQIELAKRRAGANFLLASRIEARQNELREMQKTVKEMMR